MRRVIPFIALLAIAACSSSSNDTSDGGVAGGGGTGGGGGGGNTDPIIELDPNATPAEAFDVNTRNFNRAVRIEGLDDSNNSRFTAIPSRSSAEFAGFIGIDAGRTANVSAQYDLTANFGTGNITGEQTSAFFGTNAAGDLEEYDGKVEIFYGRVGARGIDNNARIDIRGELENGTNTIGVDGEILGKFRGTPIIGMTGTARAGRDMSIMLNDRAVTNGSASFEALIE